MGVEGEGSGAGGREEGGGGKVGGKRGLGTPLSTPKQKVDRKPVKLGHLMTRLVFVRCHS